MDDQNLQEAQSPLPVKEGSVNFGEALKRVVVGKKITKLEWKNKDVYGFLKNNILMLHKEDGEDYKWTLNEGDIVGEDWVEVA